MASVVWFRNDLRIRDNPALFNASKSGEPIVAVYIIDPLEPWPIGGASKCWLHHSLFCLGEDIKSKGGRLFLFQGNPIEIIPELASNCGANQVYWNRKYDEYSVAQGTRLKVTLREKGIEALSFNGSLILEPWDLKTGQGTPYRVFTPYWNVAQKLYAKITSPLKIPKKLSFMNIKKMGCDLDELSLLSGRPWESEMLKGWRPGEAGALKQLKGLNSQFHRDYQKNRDLPAIEGTSRLAPHLHFGELSPRQIIEALGLTKTTEPFVRQVAWREFAHSLLYYNPKSPREPLNPLFKKFDWKKNATQLNLWKKGKTGYPIVDAGMRQLWATGWMHNRVRMIVASFLIKDLLIPWTCGAEWFWETLVDADLANNTMGWQWVAGCGADASPFFRIFNPITQGEKFDPNGEYVKRWVPELENVPKKFIHCPWKLSAETLADASLKLGVDYPKPIVDHGEARLRALKMYDKLKARQ